VKSSLDWEATLSYSHPDFPLEDDAMACPIAVDIDREISHRRSSIHQILLADMSYSLVLLGLKFFLFFSTKLV
jgi:hypothetical protein